MSGRQSLTDRFRFYGQIAALYVLTIACLYYAARPLIHFGQAAALPVAKLAQTPHEPAANVGLVAGRPERIVIPSEAIDLPVDPGYYDSATGTWTLSGYRAQFAMMSTLANNVSGETFIYGHNNDFVFGALRHHTPAAGAEALLYTANGHILAYRFVGAESLTPTTTAILHYHGPSILTIQTCTGGLNEWRTMYKFAFEKVMR